MLNGRGPAVALTAALLVAGTVATVNPLMNHWYFIGVRPEAMRGGAMPVPAAHRTYESDNLIGLASGPFLAGGTDVTIQSGSGAARVLVFQLLPAG